MEVILVIHLEPILSFPFYFRPLSQNDQQETKTQLLLLLVCYFILLFLWILGKR